MNTPQEPLTPPSLTAAGGTLAVSSTPVVDLSSQYQGGFTRARASTSLLIVHHAAAHYAQATGPEDVAAIARWHTGHNGWPGIGYHEVLAEETNGGRVVCYVVSDPDTQRAHIALQNDVAWGICCATDFGSGLPAQKWIDALADRLPVAALRYPQAGIWGHKDKAKPGYTTACPGSRWLEWRPQLLGLVASRLAPQAYTRVIGVKPSVTPAQFYGWLAAHHAPVDQVVADRVYTMAAWLDIDPAFVAALWAHETSQQPGHIGSSDLYKKSSNAGAIVAYGRWPSVSHNGRQWNKYESPQLGLMALLLHLKQLYGARGLVDLETMIPVYAPAGDGNKPAAYVAAVKRDMAAMRLWQSS